MIRIYLHPSILAFAAFVTAMAVGGASSFAAHQTAHASSELSTIVESSTQQPLIFAQQLKSGQSSPTGPGSLKGNTKKQRSTCTATDGTKTCYCGKKACVGLEDSCYCVEFSAPSTNSRD